MYCCSIQEKERTQGDTSTYKRISSNYSGICICSGICMSATNTWSRRSATSQADRWLTTGQRWIPLSLYFDFLPKDDHACVCHFDRGFYQPSIGRGKSWADGGAWETKERRRLTFFSKNFSFNNNIYLLLDDLQQIILISKDALLYCIRPAQKQRRLNLRFLKKQNKVCFEKSTPMI